MCTTSPIFLDPDPECQLVIEGDATAVGVVALSQWAVMGQKLYSCDFSWRTTSPTSRKYYIGDQLQLKQSSTNANRSLHPSFNQSLSSLCWPKMSKLLSGWAKGMFADMRHFPLGEVIEVSAQIQWSSHDWKDCQSDGLNCLGLSHCTSLEKKNSTWKAPCSQQLQFFQLFIVYLVGYLLHT